MTQSAKVILSGFSDEASIDKTLDQQFAAVASLGMSHFAIRFLDAGEGIKNVLDLSDREVDRVRSKMDEYHLRVSSLGSPIGKIKLSNFDDGGRNRFVEPDEYLKRDVRRACELAKAFGTALVRGFSFYPPPQSNSEANLAAVVGRLRDIVAMCDEHGLTFGLEVEANLVGNNGWILSEIHRRIDHPGLVLVFDGANLRVQGYSTEQIVEQYLALKPGLGWIHVKDYRDPTQTPIAATDSASRTPRECVDEGRLNRFVPVGAGESGYDRVFSDLKGFLPTLRDRLARRRIEGVFLELEPHLRSGGQFGGASGPDGFGVALRSLCGLLDSSQIKYDLLDWTRFSTHIGKI